MITLLQAKQHLRIDVDEDIDSAEEDALIESLINAAYLNAEKKTNRRILNRTETVVLDEFPEGDSYIELPWTPVMSIESITYVDEIGAATEIDPQTARLDSRPVYPILSPQYGEVWPVTIDEPESVTIVAATGYGEEKEPSDLKVAILLLVGHFYKNRESVVIGTTSSELPMGVEMLLGPYVIHAVG